MHCGYDLSGTPVRDQHRRCPECGDQTPIGYAPSRGVPKRVVAVSIFGWLAACAVLLLWTCEIGQRPNWMAPAAIGLLTAGLLNGLLALSLLRLIRGTFTSADVCRAAAVAVITGLAAAPVAYVGGVLGSYANV